MAANAQSIASKISSYIAEQVGHQLGYIISYESNADNLNAEVERLEEAKDIIQHSVDAATRNGEEIERTVKHWLEKVDAIVTEAKGFQDNEGHTKAKCSCGHFPNLWVRHQLSMKAKEIAQGIPSIIEHGKFQTISFKPRLLVGITSSYARGYEALDSRTSLVNEIMQTLKDANVCKIGVCGMGGVGKSTLIKELAWKVVQDGSYDVVVLVDVTNSPDVKRIQAEIAESLGMKLNEETQVGRASRLRERIRKEESILIIMDDIWEKLDLTEVGVPFGDDHKGCKLMFTSRNLNVLTCEMDVPEHFCFRLEILSKKEGWSLFEKKAGDTVKDKNLRPTALKVAEACGGLPVLIIPVANALKNKRLPAWDDALKQLTQFDHKNLTDKVYSAIELSYNHLANNELKSLFLLLGSYGQTILWIRYLLIDFWSLGLYKDADSLANARNRLYNLLMELKSACLLIEEEGESIRMHDLVHEVASKLASRDRPIYAVKMYSELKEWPEMDSLRKCYRIFLPECQIHDLPEILECPELEMLEIGSQENFIKVSDHFFAETKELKNLFLGGMDCLPSLPSSLSHLSKLRALILYECMLEDITLVAELKNLEILNFQNAEIRELPAVIGKLTRLKLLDLSNISGLRAIPAKLISSLIHLEELYIKNTFIQWEDEGSKSPSKNASLGELRHLSQLTALEIMIQDALVLPKDLLIFGQLNRYRIFIGGQGTQFWNASISKTLKLNPGKAKKNIHLDQGIKFLLNNVEELCLTDLNGVSNVLYQLNEEGFPELKHLNIRSSDEIEYIIDSKECRHSCDAFPKLESLVLHHLANMTKICDGPLLVQSFIELKVIKVKGCDRLGNVFLYSMIKDLSNLLEIEISQCKTMSEIIIIDDDTEIGKIEFPLLHSLTIDCLSNLAGFYYKPTTAANEFRSVTEYEDTIPTPLFDEKISFPNLESLKLSSINLRKIWNDQISQQSSIQKLKSLTIDGCINLKFLFPSSVARGLVNLQHLSITGCAMLEEIFFIEGKLDNLSSGKISLSNYGAAFPSLETLVISYMDSLKSIWSNQLASNFFPKLIKLEISFCNKLINIVSAYELKQLSNLETMLVSSCDSLEGVFQIEGLSSCSDSQDGLQTQLKTLTLENLPMLKHIWNKDPRGSLGFQNLCRVEVFKCPSLYHVFPMSVAMELKKLEVLQILSCGVVHIVANEEMEEIASKLVLRQLRFLQLWNLTQVRNFCHGKQSLECPNIKVLDVFCCNKLEIFGSKSRNYQDVSVDQQPLFSLEKVPQSVEQLGLSSKDVTLIYNDQQSDDCFYNVKSLSLHRFDSSDEFPNSFLQRFNKLEQLILFDSRFESIFLGEHAETNIKLKTLRLHSLWVLKNICQEKSQMEKILQNLENLVVVNCPILKTIASPFVLFQKLDVLEVYNCAALVNIMLPSTARSLLRLRKLWIQNCDMLENIVIGKDDDASEIAFMKLESVVLKGLPRLKSFCNGNPFFKFPLLKQLYVVECPIMETFSQGTLSAPLLRYVCSTLNGDEWLWDGDLNTTITNFFKQLHSKED